MTQRETESNREMRGEKKPLTHYAWLSLLRAYGVLLVLVYHFFPWLMPGGFIGVDVFLVFSGYLITSLLISEFKKQGRVDLLAFYKRRFRRLFPALAALLLLVLPLTLTIPEDFRAGIAQQVAGVLSWTTNFYEIALGRSYADTLLPHLFVHTWTLSVEMHYYLVWGMMLTVLLPLFVTTTATGRKSMVRSRRVVALFAAALALASFVAMQIMLIGAEDPSAAYYSTFSHAYPVLIGSALGALAGFSRTRLVVLFERLNAVLAIALVALSLAGIAAIAVMLSFENLLVYHLGLLLTSLLVGLIILVGRGAQESLQQRQEPKLLQYIADRSYSIYLFHWPLMIIVLEWARSLFGRIQVEAAGGYIVVAVLALALTFVASHLSYRFVEQPFSRRRRPSEKASAPQQASANSSLASETMPRTEPYRGRHAGLEPRKESATTLQGEPSESARHRRHQAEPPPPVTQGSQNTRSEQNSPGRLALPGRLSALSSLAASKVALAALAVLLAAASVFSIAAAPQRTSIERDYQASQLQNDLHWMQNAHQVLLHTGAGGNTSGEPGLLVKPGTITVIGDSVTILPADSLVNLTGAVVDAEVSRAMVNGIGIVQRMQENKTLGEFVIIALATNSHADSFESAVTICEETQPGHRLIFVTAYGDQSMEDLNAQLRTLPATYPFVTIADWAVAIGGHEDLLAADGFHLNGQEAIDIYVQVVLNALEEAKNKPTR